MNIGKTAAQQVVEIQLEHGIAAMFLSLFIAVVEHLNIKILYSSECKTILSELRVKCNPWMQMKTKLYRGKKKCKLTKVFI